MKYKLSILFLTMVVLFFSCDKYDKPIPEDVELSFLNPGIIEFIIKQSSDGKIPKLQTNAMELELINQSNDEIKAIQYSIRGFKNNNKTFQTFKYWQEGTYIQSIKPYDKNASLQLSTSFNELINQENIEIDLISYFSGDEEKKHKYSGSYIGTFNVMKDSVFITLGEHYSWINHKGFLTSYYDRKNFKWNALKGQIVSDSLFYGELILTDTIINITSTVADTLSKIQLNYDFSINTDNNYQISMTLIKN